MEENNNTVPMTIGKRLRQLTNQARINLEATGLVELLEEAANRGEDRVRFEDLRQIIPNMIMNETAWEWFRVNELAVSGQVNQETGAYEYTVAW